MFMELALLVVQAGIGHLYFRCGLGTSWPGMEESGCVTVW